MGEVADAIDVVKVQVGKKAPHRKLGLEDVFVGHLKQCLCVRWVGSSRLWYGKLLKLTLDLRKNEMG